MKSARDIALISAAIWTSLGVGGFYLLGGGWHGAIYRAFQITGGRWDIHRGVILLVVLGFLASLAAVMATLKSESNEARPDGKSSPPTDTPK